MGYRYSQGQNAQLSLCLLYVWERLSRTSTKVIGQDAIY
jgi:hypothetical protein